MACKNVGTVEQVIRILIAVALVVAIFIFEPSPIWMATMVVVALLLFFTAYIQYCPITALLGINTCEKTPYERIRMVEGQKTKSKKVSKKKTKAKKPSKAKKAKKGRKKASRKKKKPKK